MLKWIGLLWILSAIVVCLWVYLAPVREDLD
jgi:hypothetical protein